MDVTHATDVPGADPKDEGAHGLGSGPAIGRGATISPRVFELLAETAAAESIPYTIEVSTGATSTDMDAMYLARGRRDRIGLDPLLRYMHSPTEIVLDDVENCIRLIAAFARLMRRRASGAELELIEASRSISRAFLLSTIRISTASQCGQRRTRSPCLAGHARARPRPSCCSRLTC